MKQQTQTIVKESETIYSFADRKKITCSKDAEKFFRQHFTDIDDCESFHVVALSRANAIIRHKVVSFGGVAGCVADPKIIFRFVIETKGAAGLMVAHNHPSGNIKPSEADIKLTNRLREGAKLLDLVLLDHVILSPLEEQFYSFADDGSI